MSVPAAGDLNRVEPSHPLAGLSEVILQGYLKRRLQHRPLRTPRLLLESHKDALGCCAERYHLQQHAV